MVVNEESMAKAFATLCIDYPEAVQLVMNTMVAQSQFLLAVTQFMKDKGIYDEFISTYEMPTGAKH